jgi:hypothetical protein
MKWNTAQICWKVAAVLGSVASFVMAASAGAKW